MSLDAFFTASPAIKLHLVAALLSLVLVLTIALLRKGTTLHKTLGRTWVTLLALISISSFWINELDVLWGFSPIHLLSLYVLWALFDGVRAIRAGNVAQHKSRMIGVTIYGLLVAGAFTFLPGRLMHTLLITPLLN